MQMQPKKWAQFGVLAYIGLCLGAGNMFWSLPVFEKPFTDANSSLNFKGLVTTASFGFSVLFWNNFELFAFELVGPPVGFIPGKLKNLLSQFKFQRARDSLSFDANVRLVEFSTLQFSKQKVDTLMCLDK